MPTWHPALLLAGSTLFGGGEGVVEGGDDGVGVGVLGVGVPGAVGGGLEAVPEGEVGCGFGRSWHVVELFGHGQVEVSGLGVGVDVGPEDGAVPDVASGCGVLAVLGDDPEAAGVDLGVGGYGFGGVGGWVVADDAGAGAVGELAVCVGEDGVLVVVWGDEGPG